MLKVLLPLANIPMIDYTLAWLESAGVEEVFVFCCAHSKQVIDYLESSDWSSQPNFLVATIESHNSISAGDALRLIYERHVVMLYFLVFFRNVLIRLKCILIEIKHCQVMWKIYFIRLLKFKESLHQFVHRCFWRIETNIIESNCLMNTKLSNTMLKFFDCQNPCEIDNRLMF